MSNDYTLLHEKYRPETIDDVILPTNLKNKFDAIIKKNDIPNMIMYSARPGCGKSTVAKILGNQCDVDCMYINNSLERSIDLLRDKISRFASSMSFDGKSKVVILDEMDGSTYEYKQALKGFVDECQDTCRFVCTTNHVHKISEHVRSRMDMVDFNFEYTEIRTEILPLIGKRIMDILKKEEIKFDKMDTIRKLITECYPDIRTMIKLLRDCNEQYGLICSEIFKLKKMHEEFYDLILERKIMKVRKYVIEHNVDLNGIYTLLKENLIDNKKIKDGVDRGEALLVFNKYDVSSVIAPDKELNFAACLVELYKNIQ